MIGQVISHYKILEKLGEGGMGVVYKAHDTELDRDVAIKALPERLVEHDTEQRRFIQEAKAASALNHAHVCTIYDFLRVDDQQFIVMEYVDGRTLRDVIRSGVPDQTAAISYAVQIGEALEEAHAKSIVHRDVKPENIMVNSKNQIKVMDFGLAKLKGSLKLTKTSSTVGTLAYMAPEQIQGKEVDARSDIFSFGIVLYEMLSGRIPFRGEHEAALMYSILNEEPAPIEQYRPDVPQDLRHIINRSLEKDPEERYQTVHDMLIELRRLKKVSTRVVRPSEEVNYPAEVKAPLRRRTTLIITAFAFIIVAAAAYLLFMKKGVEINPDYSLRQMNVPMNTIGTGLAITSDGKWVVYSAEDENKRWDLWVASVSGGEPRQVTHDSSDQAIFPDISPDGTSIVYNRITGNICDICVVPFNGGISKKVGVGNQPQWSPDGKRIGYVLDPTELGPNPFQPSGRITSKSGNGEFWTMEPDGSGSKLEFMDSVAAKSGSSVYFAWSPNGRSVAWSHRAIKEDHEYYEIIIHDLISHGEQVIVSKGLSITAICWTATNRIIFPLRVSGEKGLWMVPAGGGTPVRITRGLASTGSPRLSVNGKTLIFLQYKNIGHLWLTKTDGSIERTEVKVGGEPYFRCPSISPDGKYITVVIPTLGGNYVNQVFILKRNGTDMHQISTGDDDHWWPTWSPDGKKIFYYARGFSDQYKYFRVYVANVPRIETPHFVSIAIGASWKDSVTLEIQDPKTEKMSRIFLDNRPPQEFSKDSIFAWTTFGGKYVIFHDEHQSASSGPMRWCRIEDWDGIGPKNAKQMPKDINFVNIYGFYYLKGSEFYRFILPDEKVVKMNVKIQDIEMPWGLMYITQDGKEMVYSSVEEVNKIGVIENLFK